MAYNITPKLKLFSKGACLKLKHNLVFHDNPGITGSDSTIKCFTETIEYPKGTAIIFLEDKQFFSPSKELRQPMSAWIRAKVIVPNGKQLWTTLYCENKTIWDFKTYNGKKENVLREISRSFEIISFTLDTNKKNIIDDSYLTK